jgi:hypothetical protein
VLLGRLACEQSDERHERGVAWKRGVGLRARVPTGRGIATVGELGGGSWKVLVQLDHPLLGVG